MTPDPLIADLDARRNAGASFQELLERAVSGLHESDPRFNWTGIYELSPDNVLRLGPFLGAPTDHRVIGVGEGVCGTAVAERRNINVPDVGQVGNYLACSTETKSELVILIRRGEKIYAQVDIDSHRAAAFDEESVAKVQRVADWLAGLYESRERPRRAP
jgi:L-methionine (R)-S-oxide reductase